MWKFIWSYSSASIWDKLEEREIACNTYRLPSQNSKFFLNFLTNLIGHFTKHFDKYIMIGDFNLQQSNTTLKRLQDSDELYNIIKLHTWFKGKSSLTNLIITERFLLKILSRLKPVLVIITIWSIPYSKLFSRNLNGKRWFIEIFQTSILKVSKMICRTIWLSVTDHFMTLM